MDCRQIEENDLIERYTAQTLGDEERERLEEHYFSCPRCLDRVRALQAVRAALTERQMRQPRRRGFWLGAMAAAAVMIAAVVGVAMLRSRAGGRKQAAAVVERRVAPLDLAELARIEPPAYTPPVLRGGTGSRDPFRAAMRRYQAGDFAGAARELQTVSRADPANMAARFYLGACYLLTGQMPMGMEELQRVVRAGDASPFEEEARFLIAKADIGRGDFDDARRQLFSVVQMHGDLQAKAAALANKLSTL